MSKRLEHAKLLQSCPTLCNPMDFSVHGALQIKILEWVSISFSRGSSQPRDWATSLELAGRFFTTETPGKPNKVPYKSAILLSPPRDLFCLFSRLVIFCKLTWVFSLIFSESTCSLCSNTPKFLMKLINFMETVYDYQVVMLQNVRFILVPLSLPT